MAPDSDSHTYIQLVYNPSEIRNSSHKKTLALLEPQGTGRCSFVILSSFTGSRHDLSLKRRKNFAWVDMMPEVLETIEMGIVQPKFSCSRILMLLRDSILRRQTTSLIIMITEIVDESNMMWLELAEHLGIKGRVHPTNHQNGCQFYGKKQHVGENVRRNCEVEDSKIEMRRRETNVAKMHGQHYTKNKIGGSDVPGNNFDSTSIKPTLLADDVLSPSSENSRIEDMILGNEFYYEEGITMNLLFT